MEAAQERKMLHEDDDYEITFLKEENQELRREVARLKAQISSLRAHDNERKSTLWKKLQHSIDSNNSDLSQQKPSRVPKPPPKPANLHSSKDDNGSKVTSAPAPPPPPPPSKFLVGSRSVRRVPEVMEFYRSLTRKDAHMENTTNPIVSPAVAFNKSMIGEIENRSTYLSAIKSEVETQREFINFLIKEVESTAYTEISDVEAFVKWLDEELSSLVDERAVLKHFPQWPERKADALREAACSYRDLMTLESEVSSFEDNPKEPFALALRRMQALQDRLELSVNSIERTRESASKRYRDFQIPWQWMHDTGPIGQMKLGSLRLATEYMKRITRELQSNECTREENLMLQGVRFALRVHQFAGGFDASTMNAFKELRNICTARNTARGNAADMVKYNDDQTICMKI